MTAVRRAWDSGTVERHRAGAADERSFLYIRRIAKTNSTRSSSAFYIEAR